MGEDPSPRESLQTASQFSSGCSLVFFPDSPFGFPADIINFFPG
jgi:ubiquinone biosynthesis protein COQ9